MADPTQTPEALKRLCDVIAELLPRVTSGPWQAGHLIDDTSSCTCRYIFGNDDRMGAVGEVYAATDELHGDEYPPLDEAKANLRLIALVPQMAAAISALTAEREDTDKLRECANINITERAQAILRVEQAEAKLREIDGFADEGLGFDNCACHSCRAFRHIKTIIARSTSQGEGG